MASAAPSRPLVFISASRLDSAWRDRLKAQLDEEGLTEPWDDSRIFPGNRWSDGITELLHRASVAVVLVSPDYVASPAAAEEFGRLTERASSGQLRLFPILVREAEWTRLPALVGIQVWGAAKPLDRMNETELRVALKNIAEEIAQVALAVHANNAATTIDAPPAPVDIKPLPDAHVDQPASPQFSDETQAVMTRARELAAVSHRAGVTTSCLLFALTETARGSTSGTAIFIRYAVERSGKYAEAFTEFLSDPGIERRQPGSDAPSPDATSANAAAMIASAADFARRTTGTPTIWNRHLLAAMLVTPDQDAPAVARVRLQQMGILVPTLVGEFRELMRSIAHEDDQTAWDAILGASAAPAAPDTSAASPADATASPATGPAERYVSGPAGYTSEFVGVGGTRPVGDQLGVKAMAHRLAELIALQETKMPLAIGLFGDWGSGKSHFMNLMDRHLKTLASGADGGSVWCREIIPIYFNAWHYLDANLWASLVTEIFDGLFRHLQPNKNALDTAREQLRAAGGAAALAEEEATQARQEVTAASTALQDARARTDQARQTVRGLLDNLGTLLLPQLASPSVRARITQWLGVGPEAATLSQLVEKHREMTSVPGRVRELGRRIWAQPGRWWRLGWLAAALIVAPLLVRFAIEASPYLQRLLGAVGPWVKIVLGWIIGAIAWLTPGIVAVQRHLREMETLQRQAERAQRAPVPAPAVVAAQQRVAEAEAAARAAESRLADARQRERELTQAVDELQPTRRLSRFIEARARSADYRGQLGLVSLARRDFQELSDIFADRDALNKKKAQLEQDHKPEKAAALESLSASIDRIVLFVDDLDRCQPEKVVDVLQAVHLLLAYPLFSVIVGVDQRCLRQSLRTQFPGLLAGDRPLASRGRAGVVEDEPPVATPLDYLEKIFHVPFHLPRMNKDGFADLMTALTRPSDRGAAAPAADTKTAGVTGAVSADPQASPRALAPSPAPSTTSSAAGSGAATPHEPTVSAATISNAGDAGAPAPKTIGSVPLQDWERKALKDYHALVRTPRAATRFLNTYRLLRAGIVEKDWPVFCGDGATHGEFRIAMLLLATAAGHPAVARDWFSLLRVKAPQEVSPADVEADAAGWQRFTTVYTDTLGPFTAGPAPESLATWIDRVEQFAF